jgi:xylulokinase
MASLLGIDIGTTHCKAGLFNSDGVSLKIAKRQTITHYNSEGQAAYKPAELWETVASAIKEVTEKTNEKIMVIGVTSMAETGLLVDRNTGKPKTDFIPWFDSRSKKEAQFIEQEADLFERFQVTGLHNSYKYGLAKLLWLKNKDPDVIKDAVWLSAADYIAYKLTGKYGTDYTLAARTFAFRMDQKVWDVPWIRSLGLDENLFPDVSPSGGKLGEIQSSDLESIGLVKGIPVAVSGHDHVCAALAVGAVEPGVVFDSIGTAETLAGTLYEQKLGEREYISGLSFGCHVAKNRMFWMGGLPNSGGSIEWVRSQLGEEPITYNAIQKLLSKAKKGPTGILYFPYITGSGAPNPDPLVKGAFIGLDAKHKRHDLLKAVLEGTAFEMEWIRETAANVTGLQIDRMIVVGGGTKNLHWMQIKSDVSRCRLFIPEETEATLLGAALTAAIGCGIYADGKEGISVSKPKNGNEISPNNEHHIIYQTLYRNGYISLQKLVRTYSQNISLGDE